MRTITVPLTLINLQDDGFHLLVEIVVFGKKSFVVLDTGASRSVFDMTLIKNNISELEYGEETHATTLFATSSTIQATIPKIKMGRLVIHDYETVALDLESVNQAYDQMGHPMIAGIIGSDILLKYEAVINYKKLKLFLYSN
ncbi:aspartyl protease family protein [Pedobacter sp. PLR]|uniref:aspartyl protease family protein n=1 Tax=Pedobacter sp. PLR TaxID=2994465 RepID=UPI0022474E94|nr:aspartyl protease family protein [Pedobacter sp. PLR]MCX2450924.1 aspartyl protease family protein [Pedobacter sp. PLR]